MKPEILSEMLKALSSEMRLRILLLLRERRLCAGGISRKLDASPSAASQHLRILRTAGLVTACRCGNKIHYSLNREAMAGVSSSLEELIPLAGKNEDDETATNPCGRSRHGKE